MKARKSSLGGDELAILDGGQAKECEVDSVKEVHLILIQMTHKSGADEQIHDNDAEQRARRDLVIQLVFILFIARSSTPAKGGSTPSNCAEPSPEQRYRAPPPLLHFQYGLSPLSYFVHLEIFVGGRIVHPPDSVTTADSAVPLADQTLQVLNKVEKFRC